eukprot:g18498.t1
MRCVFVCCVCVQLQQPPQLVFGWFVAHLPPSGPYLWSCLPPGYTLVPLEQLQQLVDAARPTAHIAHTAHTAQPARTTRPTQPAADTPLPANTPANNVCANSTRLSSADNASTG